MSHALATVLHRGRKAASNIMPACLASSREARWEMGLLEVRSASREARAETAPFPVGAGPLSANIGPLEVGQI